MNNMNHAHDVEDPTSSRTSYARRLRKLAATGFIATLAAMLATTLAAVLAQAVGVEFVVSHGGELIPLSGIAVMTGFFSVVGVVMAAALLRWSTRPAELFVWTAVSAYDLTCRSGYDLTCRSRRGDHGMGSPR